MFVFVFIFMLVVGVMIVIVGQTVTDSTHPPRHPALRRLNRQ
jgi:hypothetical protein